MDRQLLLAKIETVYGTDAEAAAANTVLAENVRYTPRGQTVTSAPAKPGVGPTPGQVTGEHGELTFEVPLAGSGTAGTAPPWGVLMLAAGWDEAVVEDTSVTYALAVNPQAADSMTLVWRDARRKHTLVGARGRVGLRVVAGQRPMLTFTFRGLHADVAAGAALAHADATWTGWSDAKPVAQGRTTFSLGGEAMALRELNFESSDNIRFTDVPHQENVELLGERAFTGRVKAGMPAVGDFNPETQWRTGALVVAQLIHEVGSAGRIVTVNTRGQLGEPSYSRDADHDCFEANYALKPSALNTDDDVAIVLT